MNIILSPYIIHFLYPNYKQFLSIRRQCNRHVARFAKKTVSISEYDEAHQQNDRPARSHGSCPSAQLSHIRCRRDHRLQNSPGNIRPCRHRNASEQVCSSPGKQGQSTVRFDVQHSENWVIFRNFFGNLRGLRPLKYKALLAFKFPFFQRFFGKMP